MIFFSKFCTKNEFYSEFSTKNNFFSEFCTKNEFYLNLCTKSKICLLLVQKIQLKSNQNQNFQFLVQNFLKLLAVTFKNNSNFPTTQPHPPPTHLFLSHRLNKINFFSSFLKQLKNLKI